MGKTKISDISDPEDWEIAAGEHIQEWLDNLPLPGDFREFPDEDHEMYEDFKECNLAWVFTDRGWKLYEKFVDRVNALGNKKFPDYGGIDVSNHTGVIQI